MDVQKQQAAIDGYGVSSMSAPLRRVLVCAPAVAFAHGIDAWSKLGFLAQPDVAAAVREHEAFTAALAHEGVAVEYLQDAAGTLTIDSMYTHDPGWMTPAGMILLNPGKENRVVEVEALRRHCEARGIPVVGCVAAPGTVEGGDCLWLDDQTVAVGCSYRTNPEGIAQMSSILALQGIAVMALDLPHFKGPADLLHLQSLVSWLAEDLVIAYTELMPVRLASWFLSRNVRIIPCSYAEFREQQAPNVLCIRPRVILAVGRRKTEAIRAMEEAGCRVLLVDGAEIALNGCGGPTCLTRPIWRHTDGSCSKSAQ